MIEQAYQLAKARYQEVGVDVDKAMEQLAKMAADYAISNAKDLQSPAKDPLTGTSGKTGTAAEQMAKDASESIKKYL